MLDFWVSFHLETSETNTVDTEKVQGQLQIENVKLCLNLQFSKERILQIVNLKYLVANDFQPFEKGCQNEVKGRIFQ